MANKQSAQKRIKTSERNRIKNKGYRSQYKTGIKSIDAAIETGEKDTILKAFSTAQKFIDKAASAGAIHKNKAARKKSQIAAKFAALEASKAE